MAILNRYVNFTEEYTISFLVRIHLSFPMPRSSLIPQLTRAAMVCCRSRDSRLRGQCASSMAPFSRAFQPKLLRKFIWQTGRFLP